ncbi:MAG TPA: protein kinase, partial [Methylomirabilota bacterium]
MSHYRLIRKLGAGGMGEVYLARDLTLERQVAIKVISRGRQHDEPAKRRLLREAQAAAALEHPNICAVYEAGSDQGHGFVVMQFCEGETLARRLERGPLPLQEALDVVGQIAEALAFAHRAGIVHRDIKPHNIMLTPGGRVKVLDFGLAKIAPSGSPPSDSSTETGLTQQGSPVGTAAYMSPEQIRCEPIDARSDLFSVGVVLFECLTGRRPFDGPSTYSIFDAIVHHDPPSPAAINPHVPPELAALCLRLLAKSRSERVQSADELRGSILLLRHRSGSDSSVAAVIQTAAARAGRRARRMAVIVLAAVALLLGMLWFTQWRPLPLAAPSPAARQWYQQGLQSLHDGSFQDAARALEQAVRVDGGYAMAWARLAEAQAQLDDMRNAPQSLNRVWQLVPNRSRLPDAERLQLEAVAAVVSRRGEDAVAAYRALADAHPGDASVLVDLGRAYEIVPDFAEAEAAYTAALQADGQSAAAFLQRARLRGQRGAFDEAIEDFASAERLFRAGSDLEGQVEVLLQRALLFARWSRPSDARTQAERALEMASAAELEYQRIRAHLLVSTSLLSSAEFQAAEAHAREAVAQSARFEALQAQALVDLGNVFLAQARFEPAVEHFRSAQQVAARFGAERAEARAKLALASALVTANDGRVAEGVGLADEASAYYERNRFHRERLQALQVMGRAAEITGDLDAADRAYHDLLAAGERASDPAAIASAHDGLGHSLARRGRLPAASDAAARALAAYEQQNQALNARYARLLLAGVAIRLGRLPTARAALETLRDSAGESFGPAITVLEANQHLASGEPREAARLACGDA